MYYYLRELKGYDVNIIGLDLKTDVIEKCNGLAVKYGYEKLHFYQGDIADYEGVSSVDMVVTPSCLRYCHGLRTCQSCRVGRQSNPFCSMLSA